MTAMILDPNLKERLIAERAALGIDRFDEVWEGTYMMAPAPNNEHQEIATNLARPLLAMVTDRGRGRVFTTVNVSDREVKWTENYRVPDVVVVLRDCRAVDRKTHWLGGPSLAVEIVSEGDRSREKLEFYEKIETSELLILDRDPWQLELFRFNHGELRSVAKSGPGGADIQSDIGFAIRLESFDPGKDDRPEITVIDEPSDRTWSF